MSATDDRLFDLDDDNARDLARRSLGTRWMREAGPGSHGDYLAEHYDRIQDEWARFREEADAFAENELAYAQGRIGFSRYQRRRGDLLHAMYAMATARGKRYGRALGQRDTFCGSAALVTEFLLTPN